MKGDSNVSYTTRDGKVTTATYVAAATFENGEGNIKVRLIQSPSSGQWQFLNFYVDSPLLLQ